MYRRVGKALAEPDLPPRQGPIVASQLKVFKERVEWVGGVRYDGSCSTYSGSVIEVWEVRGGEANELAGFASDLCESVLLWGFKQVEKAGGTVKDDGLNDTLVEH